MDNIAKVQIIGASGRIYEWNQALTVNVWDDGHNMDVFTLSDASFNEFRASVERREQSIRRAFQRIADQRV